MTYQDLERAFAMRIRGASYVDIANAMGYTPQAVRGELISAVRLDRTFRIPVVYPAIREYIVQNCDGRISVFSKQCGLKECTMRNFLSGRAGASQKTMQRIISCSGLNSSTAFKREEKAENEHI